jgi:hypothetical protein
MEARELLTIIRGGECEEQLIHGTSIDDIVMEQFKIFILRKYKKSIDDFQLDSAQMPGNLNLS